MMFQTKDTLISPDWRVVGLVVAFGMITVGTAMAQDNNQQQEVQSLEERINAYQTGKAPSGPTRAELLTQVSELESKITSLKEQLVACKEAAEE